MYTFMHHTNSNILPAQTGCNYLDIIINVFSVIEVSPARYTGKDYPVKNVFPLSERNNINGMVQTTRRSQNKYYYHTTPFTCPFNNAVLLSEKPGGRWVTSSNTVMGSSAWIQITTTSLTASHLSGKPGFAVANETALKHAAATATAAYVNPNTNVAEVHVVVAGTETTLPARQIYLRWNKTSVSFGPP